MAISVELKLTIVEVSLEIAALATKKKYIKRLLQVLFFLMVHTALLCDKQNVLCLQCNSPPTLP